MAGLTKSRLRLKRRSWDVLTYRILEENGRLNGSCLTEMRFTNSWIYEYKNILRGNLRAGSGVYPEMPLFPIGYETMKGRVDGRGSLLLYSEGNWIGSACRFSGCLWYHDDQEILHGVNLTIPQHGMTALVGPSGSGKSTLAKLAAGFWDVKSGAITMGGHDLKEIPLTQLYEQTAFVSQDNYLFDDTVRENIRMGRLSATDAEVEAAAHAAGCDGFIAELEKGYDTLVGGGGAHLSGGKRQRIAIARAMLKDAPVVILDEATAFIDPENEAIIQSAVARLVKGKTVIVIAHRLSTITGADNIVVV